MFYGNAKKNDIEMSTKIHIRATVGQVWKYVTKYDKHALFMFKTDPSYIYKISGATNQLATGDIFRVTCRVPAMDNSDELLDYKYVVKVDRCFEHSYVNYNLIDAYTVKRGQCNSVLKYLPIRNWHITLRHSTTGCDVTIKGCGEFVYCINLLTTRRIKRKKAKIDVHIKKMANHMHTIYT